MALVKLKDVEVISLNRTGFGVVVAEKFQVQGKERQTRFMVWFEEPHGLQVGQTVSLSGFLGAKVGDPWVGQDGVERRSVELSVNKPKFEGEPAAPAAVPVAHPVAGFGGGFGSEPF